MTRQDTKDPRTTISVKVDQELKEEYQAAINQSMSADLRAYIQRRATSNHHQGLQPPSDDDALREGYEALLQAVETYSPPDSRRLTVNRAAAEVSQQIGVPKDALKDRIFRPLESRGYIRVAGGRLTVIGWNNE